MTNIVFILTTFLVIQTITLTTLFVNIFFGGRRPLQKVYVPNCISRCTQMNFRVYPNINHRKCQKEHSGIVSGRQGLGQARTLARRQYKKKKTSSFSKMSFGYYHYHNLYDYRFARYASSALYTSNPLPFRISITRLGSSLFNTAAASEPLANAYMYSIFTLPSTI